MFNVGFIAEAAPTMTRVCKRVMYGLAVLFLLAYFTTAAHAQTNLYAANNPANGTTLLTANLTEYNNVVSLGWEGQGVIGRILTSSVGSGVTPLYRLYNSSNGDRLFTIDTSEVNRLIASNGYMLEGVTGYVYIGNVRDPSRRGVNRYSNSFAIHRFAGGGEQPGFTYESTAFWILDP